MEIPSKLAFLKCFFCNKNFNKLQLIDMNHNTVFINEEELKYSEILFDTCLLKLDDTKNNFVCNECNNSLLAFHFFKRDTRKYSNFREHLEKLEFLAKLETFLNDIDDLPSLYVSQSTCKFTVSLFEETIEQEEILTSISKEEETKVIEVLEDAELIEYDSGEVIAQEVETDQEYQVIKLTESESYDDCNYYSNGKLEWIETETKQCEVQRGRQTIYNCSICSAHFNTSAAMANHLEDVHINLEKEGMNEADSDELDFQARACRYNEVFAEGEQVKWRCSFCQEKKIYSNEHAFKLHYRIVHRRVDDTKTLPVRSEIYHGESWIEDSHQASFEETLSVVEAGDDAEYLISEEESHSTKKRKLNTLNDLNEEQVNWIRKEVAAGETLKGKKKVYSCTVCGRQLTTPASLTRHLRDIHVLREEKDEKNVLRAEVNSSRLVVETSNGSKTVYKCQQCENDRVFQSEQSFKQHLRMSHIRTTKIDAAFVAACKTTITEDGGRVRDAWKCPNCQRVFKHRDSLRYHIKLEHPTMNEAEEVRVNMGTIENNDKVRSRIAEKLERKIGENSSSSCSECGLKFISSQLHIKSKVHRESHEMFKVLAPLITTRFKCDPCRTVFNSEASYEAHVQLHDTSECGLIIEAEGLAQHGASFYKDATGDADDAVDEAVWKCGHCNVRYFDENDCLTHIMLLHSSPLYCLIDNREFTGSVGLSKFIQHMRNKHPELFPELSYPCGVCKLTFPTIYEKLAHQRVCDAKKFQCDFCDKRFAKKHQLQSHILYERNLSGFSCEFCGKRCKTFSDLKIHSNVHSHARPYECSQCSKTFKTPGARSTHMESHNTEGVYCEVCGLKLANRTLYQRHKRFQHNQDFREKQMEKYFCTSCDKSFLRSSIYKQHMKQAHDVGI